MIMSFLNFVITFISEYGLWCFFAVIFLGGGFLIFKEDKKGLLSRRVMFVAITGISTVTVTYTFISYINPNYTCLGYSTKDFKIVMREGNILSFMNEIGSTTSKTMGYSIYRIQGLNLDDGKIIYQKSCRRYNEVIGCEHSLVLIQSAYKGLDIRGIDGKTGETKTTVDEDYLKNTFPELQSGVYSYNFNSQTELLDIVSKESTHMSFDFLTGKIGNGAFKEKRILHYSVTPNEIIDIIQTTKAKAETKNKRSHLDSIRDKQLQSNLTYAQLDAEYEKLPNNAYQEEGFISLKGDERQKLCNQKGEVLNNELSFLNGEFVLYDSLTQNSFIISYKTLDKIEFNLSCVSIKGNLLWKADKSNLHINDFFNKDPKYMTAFIYNKNAIFVFEGRVILLNKDSGSVIWLTRM